MRLAGNKKPATTVKKAKPLTNNRLPSVWNLYKDTFKEVWTFWRPISAVCGIYAALQFVMVMGFSFSSSLDNALLLPSGRLGNAFSSIFSSLNTGLFIGNSQSDATALVQLMLFLVASMALIWTLRKLQGLKSIKVLDAYYFGTSAIVATFVVSLVLVLALTPGLIASGLVSTVLQFGGSGVEVVVVGIIAALLLIVSVYLFFMAWPAFYIVSLPNTKPIKALRSAAKLTKKRRFAIIRKSLAFFVTAVLAVFIVLLPVALVLPSVIPAVTFLALFIFFAIGHIYFYNLYRSLL